MKSSQSSNQLNPEFSKRANNTIFRAISKKATWQSSRYTKRQSTQDCGRDTIQLPARRRAPVYYLHSPSMGTSLTPASDFPFFLQVQIHIDTAPRAHTHIHTHTHTHTHTHRHSASCHDTRLCHAANYK